MSMKAERMRLAGVGQSPLPAGEKPPRSNGSPGGRSSPAQATPASQVRAAEGYQRPGNAWFSGLAALGAARAGEIPPGSGPGGGGGQGWGWGGGGGGGGPGGRGGGAPGLAPRRNRARRWRR